MSDLDFTELEQLNRDLTTVEHLIPNKGRQAVQQTAIRTKGYWQGLAKAHGSRTRGYAPTIDYEVHGGSGSVRAAAITAQIGPNLSRYGGKTGKGGLQPSLGILEEAPGGVRGTPRHDDRRAAKFAAAELDKGIQIAVEQSLRAAGL